jgi:hypothetical protein
MPRHLKCFVLSVSAIAVLAAAANPAQAQSAPAGRTYVSASVFADIKRFSGDPAEPLLDGDTVGGGLTIGTALAPRWDVQVGLDMPRFSATSRERSVTLGRTEFVLQSVTENRGASVTALLRFRAASRGRVQLGYLGGLTFVRLRRNVHTEAEEGTPAGIIPRPESTVDYDAAPTIGIDARIGLGRHLSLVPGVHATVVSVLEANGLMVRPRVAIRWEF